GTAASLLHGRRTAMTFSGKAQRITALIEADRRAIPRIAETGGMMHQHKAAPSMTPRATQFPRRFVSGRHRGRYHAPAAVAMPSLSTFAALLPRGRVSSDHV